MREMSVAEQWYQAVLAVISEGRTVNDSRRRASFGNDSLQANVSVSSRRDQAGGALHGEQAAFVAVERRGEVGALIRGFGLGQHLVAPLLGCQGGLGASGQLADQCRDQ